MFQLSSSLLLSFNTSKEMIECLFSAFFDDVSIGGVGCHYSRRGLVCGAKLACYRQNHLYSSVHGRAGDTGTDNHRNQVGLSF